MLTTHLSLTTEDVCNDCVILFQIELFKLLIHAVFSTAVNMDTLNYNLISEMNKKNILLTWDTIFEMFDEDMMKGPVMHRIMFKTSIESLAHGMPNGGRTTLKRGFEWKVSQIEPTTTGIVATWETFPQWRVVLAMDGAHCFKLQIYEASPGDKHDYKLAMHSQINYSHHEKNHGSAYRSGSIFFNREWWVCQLNMFSRSN